MGKTQLRQIELDERVFQQLAENVLEGPCEASPAISGARIFIRSQGTLFYIRDKRTEGPR